MADDRTPTPAAQPAPVLPVNHHPASLAAARPDRAGLLRTLGDNLPAGFIYQVEATPDGGRRFTYLSAGVERLFGVAAAEALSDAGAVYRLIHPDDAARVAAAEAEALAGTAPFDCEFRVRSRAGREVWVHCRSAPERLADGSVVWDGLLTDATARKRAEDELRKKEAELTDFVENATVGLHWVGPDGTILWVNRAELDLLGYAREEYVGRNIAEFHADPPVITDILCRLTNNEELQGYEARLTCKDGSVRHVLISSNVYRENGEFRHTRCFTRDITERKRAEEQLRASEEQFRTLAESIPQLAWMAHPDGHIFWYNRRWYEYTGTTPEQMEGWGWQRVHDPEVLPAVLERWKGSSPPPTRSTWCSP